MSLLTTDKRSWFPAWLIGAGFSVNRFFGACLALAALCSSVLAQTNAPADVRRLSLHDCIELALKNNLDLQIDRSSYTAAVFTLAADYGAYDPTISISGEHDHTVQGATVIGGFPIPGVKSDNDIFSANILNGLTPWGTKYNVQSRLNDQTGDSFVPVTVLTTNGGIVTSKTENVPVPFQNSAASVKASITQPLLQNFWIDSARLTIRQDKNRLKWSEWNLKLQIITIITRLEQAYYDLIYNRENVVVKEKALEAAQRLVAENRKKVEVGALAPLDLRSAESQAAASEADLIDARNSLAVQEATIKSFITGQYRDLAPEPIEPVGELTAPRQSFSLQESWAQGLTKRPEIVQARLDVERHGIQLKYDKNQLLPELDLFGTFGYNGSGLVFSGALSDMEQNEPSWSVGGSISMPLSRTAPRNTYRLHKTQMEGFVLTVKRWERDIMVDIDKDIRTARSSYEQVGARRAARQFAEADLDAEEKKLQSGKSTPYTVLQKLRDLTTARGNEILALSTYNKNLSQLSQDEGTTLERLKVGFQVK